MRIKGTGAFLLAALLLSGCAGFFEEPELVPELNYSALSCEQLAIELTLEIQQLSVSQRLLAFEEAIPGGNPRPHERAIAQRRLNIDAILRQNSRCGSPQ